MKYIIPIIIFSLLLFGCKADEEDSSSTKTDAELQATWKTACYVNNDDNTSIIFTATFSGSTISTTDEKHSDTSCATDYRLNVESFAYEIEEKGKFIITIGSTYQKTAQSSTAVTNYNSQSKCGHSDWALGTAKDCSNGDDAGLKRYCLYEVSGSTLYVDCGESYPTSNTKTSDSTYTKQ